MEYEPPAGWKAWTSGSFDPDSGKVPLFHHGKIDAPGDRDVAIAVDGVVAGWATSRSVEDGNPFDVLLAEPLATGAKGTPVLYDIRPFNRCLLHKLSS